MENNLTGALVGSEIHGFHTLQALDVRNIIEEARARWLRPNEIYAILCNYKYFGINAKPLHLPPSGTIVLFDRKMLRNFRKDGHNWKKKKDGKTVKEAHEHLKVGNEERIHVYYAHGLDNPTFVRRCYWLLDKALENIVLVHYRETQELQGSPVTPVTSNSSIVSDPSATWLASEEFHSEAGHTEPSGSSDRLTAQNHEMRLREINTLEWDELVGDDPNNMSAVKEGSQPKGVSFFEQHNIAGTNSINNGGLSANMSSLGSIGEHFTGVGLQTNSNPLGDYDTLSNSNSIHFLGNNGLQSEDSFGQWMNYIMADPQDSPDGATVDSSLSSSYYTNASPEMGNTQSSIPKLRFSITDIAPTWAYSNEETKILITGFFHEEYNGHATPNLICICGEFCLHAEVVQVGVYRCLLSPQPSGLVNLFMSIDGQNPISQVVNFECRSPPVPQPLSLAEDKLKLEELSLKTRLALLLYSAPRSLDIASFKVTSAVQMEAKRFTFRTSNIMREWAYLISSVEDDRMSLQQAKDGLFDLMLKTRLKDWILERVICGYKASEYDVHGQGVIHLCTILGYTWAVSLFSWSGLSLDFRDKFGWTALHWAAYCGREDMVAKLLSAGAKPNLVTDPTSENPGGCTAADLASKKGYDGLAAYLAEKALVQHFNDMSIAGNICGALQTGTNDLEHMGNISEEELFLKDSLTAYRTAADAAARIQAAFREHSFKIRARQVEYMNTEDDARNIVAAMKIQHAFRNHDTKKRMAAAARIQYTFRTWKMRKEFLHLRNQAIRIQAAFRGFQIRRQYRKILWSVGLLEKAILRWRMKRKGFRGFHVEQVDSMTCQTQDSDTEDDFFRTGRRQAEDRLERSVVKVQAMFRSKKAQQQYRRMKLAHVQAKLEYNNMLVTDGQMER